MDYEIIDNITSADIAVRVYARTLNDLFIKGGIALISEMAENPLDIDGDVVREGMLEQPDLELLFFDYLNEILFYKDAEHLILKPVSADIEKRGDKFYCRYRFQGEDIDISPCRFRVDIKAVSLHNLLITEDGDGYSATAVFDV